MPSLSAVNTPILGQSGLRQAKSLNRLQAMNQEEKNFESAKEFFLRGIDFLDQEKFHEAEENFLKSLQLVPNRQSTLINLTIAQLKIGKVENARVNCELALRLNPNDPSILNQLGLIYQKTRNYGESIFYFRQAIEMNRSCFDAYLNLGNLLSELNRYEDALLNYEKAIECEPSQMDAYSHRGNALKNLNRFEEAAGSYKKAIELNPDFADAWTGLARLQLELGSFEEAEKHYGKAHSINPEMVDPLCGLAEVKGYRVEGPIVSEIEKRLSDEDLTSNERAQLIHAFAKICDEAGRYDEAFERFSESKKLLKNNFDIEKVASSYSALASLFSREFVASRNGFGLPDERPVFVVGMPRSGTTLVEQILTSHHQIDGLGELRNIHIISKSLGGGIENPVQFAEAVRRLTIRDTAKMAQKYCEVFSRSKKQFVRLIDKNPHNFEMLGIIALLFPKAHIIHCRRDPLDTCVSMYTHKFSREHGYNQDFSVLGRYYREYEKLMEHWKNALPIKIFEFDYEKNIEDIESLSRSAISFLGLEWDPNCLNYYKHSRRVATPSLWQVRQPLYSKSVGRWRHYEKHLGPLKEALGAS
jgi:tetratricopeptide (TPR) repeat protein